MSDSDVVPAETAADPARVADDETQARLPPSPPPPRAAASPSPAPTEPANARPPPMRRMLRRQQKRYRTTRRATCPDPGSLFDILRANCGRSLFVLPILWTDMHARLLRTAFVQRPPILPDLALLDDMPAHQSECDASDFLTMIETAQDPRSSIKVRAIKSVFLSLFPTPFARHKGNADLDLHFGDRVFRKAVRVPVVWLSPNNGAGSSSFDSATTQAVSSFGGLGGSARENNADLLGLAIPPSNSTTSSSSSSQQSALDGPIVAYINRGHLALIRQNLFRIVPGPKDGDYNNTPVSRLQCLRSKQLRPRRPDRDPYLMGVFLAMAQAHFYDSAASRSPSQQSQGTTWWANAHHHRRGGGGGGRWAVPVAEFHDVKLRIVMHDDETKDFFVYTTTVTADMLRMFAEPTKNTTATDKATKMMTISFTRVPTQPYKGLRARLAKALGADLVGDLTEEEGAETESRPDDGVSVTDSQAQAKDPGPSSSSSNRNSGSTDASTDEQGGSRVDSLKRKRGERKSLADALHGSSSSSSSSAKEDGKDVPSPPGTPPMSPLAKRRRTRSLSSSLTVC